MSGCIGGPSLEIIPGFSWARLLLSSEHGSTESPIGNGATRDKSDSVLSIFVSGERYRYQVLTLASKPARSSGVPVYGLATNQPNDMA
jgi:hypothetical protein